MAAEPPGAVPKGAAFFEAGVGGPRGCGAGNVRAGCAGAEELSSRAVESAAYHEPAAAGAGPASGGACTIPGVVITAASAATVLTTESCSVPRAGVVAPSPDTAAAGKAVLCPAGDDVLTAPGCLLGVLRAEERPSRSSIRAARASLASSIRAVQSDIRRGRRLQPFAACLAVKKTSHRKANLI